MKASIIIPAYNAEAFLEGAVRSVTDFPPSFPYEILIVDDGSRDNTAQIAEALAEKNGAIRLIRQENGGPSAARNRGIREAKGKYILFLDSDDAFLPHAVEEAVTGAEKAEAPLLIFGYSVVNEKGSFSYGYRDLILRTPQDFKEHLAPLYGANMLNQVWGKVILRELLVKENILFPHTKWGEDRLFFFQALEKTESLCVMQKSLYRYIQQKDSLISRFQPDKAEICHEIHRRILSLAEKNGPLEEREKEIFSYMYIKSLLSVFATLYAPHCPLSGKEKRAFVRSVLASELIPEAKKYPPECGKSFRILARAVQSRSVTLNLALAFLVRVASRALPELFRRAKHGMNR